MIKAPSTIAIPSIIKIYNWFMGGTDSMDQRISYYRPNVKSVSWVPKLMIHFLNISVVNSYILYKEYFNKPATYSLLDFLGQLIEELAEPMILNLRRNGQHVINHQSSGSGFKTKKKWSQDWITRLTGEHRMVILFEPRID